MSLIQDSEIRSLKEDESIIESLGRGRGTLMIRLRGKTYSAIYRYWKGKKRCYIHIGTYKASNKSSGFTLGEIRNKALELSLLRQKVAPTDLKEFIQQQEIDLRLEAERKHKEEAAKAAQGTLTDLLTSYLATLERREAVDRKNIKRMFDCYCLKPFPRLGEKKAKDITSDDIVMILARMIQLGVTTTTNRVRGYLKAAFNYGLKADHDPRQHTEQGKRFYLQNNPVDATPIQADYERVRDRRLSDQEIKEFWDSFDKARPTASKLFFLLLKFCLACYGNRPQQLLRCKWGDIDTDNHSITFIERKGKGAKPRKRVIPLSPIALDILAEAKQHTPSDEYIFSIRGKKPFGIPTLGHEVAHFNDWREKQANLKGSPRPERWTAKDLRRTATSLLTRLHISQEHRYLLQSRENGSIESKHYDHDDRLPEKRIAAARYDLLLKEVIDGTTPPKVVNLDYYRT